MKSKWSIKRLSEVAEIQMGQSPKGSSYNISGEGVPLINGPVEFGETPFSRTKRTKFTTEPTKMCRAGDLILCVRGSTTGRMNIAGYDSCIGRGVASIRSEKYQDWINFFIYVNRETIYRLGSGATFPNVSGSMLAKLEIPIPPESEQKRIVAILDEAFEGIDRAIANTEKNLANSRELFESYLNAIFTQKGDRWGDIKSQFVPLSTLLSEQPRNGWSPPAIFQTGEGIPVLTLSAVTGFNYDGSRVKLTSAPTKEKAHYWLKEGELLITRSNTPELVGHVAIYDGNPQQAICCDLIMKMTLDSTKADTKFIYYYLRSLAARKYFMSNATGASATMPKINKQVVQNAPIPVFCLAEQKFIVTKLDEIASETQRLETIYRKKIAALNELKQSILQKAFTGELTADTRKTAQEGIAA